MMAFVRHVALVVPFTTQRTRRGCRAAEGRSAGGTGTRCQTPRHLELGESLACSCGQRCHDLVCGSCLIHNEHREPTTPVCSSAQVWHNTLAQVLEFVTNAPSMLAQGAETAREHMSHPGSGRTTPTTDGTIGSPSARHQRQHVSGMQAGFCSQKRTCAVDQVSCLMSCFTHPDICRRGFGTPQAGGRGADDRAAQGTGG